jgi:hypothetical protein
MKALPLPTLRYLSERDHELFKSLIELLKLEDFIFYDDFNGLSSKIMREEKWLPDVRGKFARCVFKELYAK